MTSSIPPEQMQLYIQTAQQRERDRIEQRSQRYRQGLQVAEAAAQILKQTFGVQRVVLFGSWLNESKIHAHSDLDLAVWGLDEALYFKAIAQLEDINPDFSIDLVRVEQAYPHIQQAIEQGVEL
ncbi:MAG: nucleotidyltransferase domain-containing protein [Oculatellaceae cyanobacterium Prado106]|jgi:predicted nucleotidyltransferase|nr:nucleotidyltransferase domain-containing protein [Oculatellaceae cyanobacterium Prado106]